MTNPRAAADVRIPYLAAIGDWYGRRARAWRVLIALELDFCAAAVTEVLPAVKIKVIS